MRNESGKRLRAKRRTPALTPFRSKNSCFLLPKLASDAVLPILKPKIPIWVNSGGPYVEWKMLVNFWSFGMFYGHLVYSMAIW
jgi:hypothetical protein